MEAAFVSQQPTNGGTDFDRVLASIYGGIGDYLGTTRPAVQVPVVPAPPAATASVSPDWLFLGVVALGVYFLMH